MSDVKAAAHEHARLTALPIIVLGTPGSGKLDPQLTAHAKEEALRANPTNRFASPFLEQKLHDPGLKETRGLYALHFSTLRFRVEAFVAPGSRKYMKNLMAGIAQSECGIVLVSAAAGEFEREFELPEGDVRRHILLAYAMGVKQLIIAVNKMDAPSVKWSQKRYATICERVLAVCADIGFSVKDGDVRCTPLSAVDAIGCVDWKIGTDSHTETKAGDVKWCESIAGPNTLREMIDTFRAPNEMPGYSELISAPLRISTHRVHHIGGAAILCGRVVSGTLPMDSDTISSLRASGTFIPPEIEIKSATVSRVSTSFAVALAMAHNDRGRASNSADNARALTVAGQKASQSAVLIQRIESERRQVGTAMAGGGLYGYQLPATVAYRAVNRPQRGRVIGHALYDPPENCASFLARVQLLFPTPPIRMYPNTQKAFQSMLFAHSSRVPCHWKRVIRKTVLPVPTPVADTAAATAKALPVVKPYSEIDLRAGESAIVEFVPITPICVEPYSLYPGMGRIVLTGFKDAIIGVGYVVSTVRCNFDGAQTKIVTPFQDWFDELVTDGIGSPEQVLFVSWLPRDIWRVIHSCLFGGYANKERQRKNAAAPASTGQTATAAAASGIIVPNSSLHVSGSAVIEAVDRSVAAAAASIAAISLQPKDDRY